ncbi:hypothetical protein GOBAR_AA26079 [Gossypium barbadense]|uniref:Uncharacterized protein n=1 Tax=Gossypium barbadense TaxID=3634 RepID=A0A2P5WU49_GOSBA|nr:hypothetical protein GOBAR_AA26079 [Gossypium barbadense]
MAVGELYLDIGVGMETHGHARDNARFCFFDKGVRHARAVKPWITIHGRVLAEISPSPLLNPYSQPPLPSRPVHVAASYANISEHLTRFELQCFQQFDNIDATLQQSCQHSHLIASPASRTIQR